MRCEEVARLLTDYSVGLVRRGQRCAVEQHLAQCEACAAEFRELAGTVAVVRSLPEAEPARDLWPVIRARVLAEPSRLPKNLLLGNLSSYWRPAMALAAAGAAAAALWIWPAAPPTPSAGALAAAQAPYVREHLQFTSVGRLSGAAAAEPVIIFAARYEGLAHP
ncbi:MAG: hypothetical protein HY321_05855 [Armatimonadetes bacterium]|nr:hypothetical protein [Armatimonadota bacterium]